MKQGKTDLSARHAVDWSHPDFLDEAALDKELRRVFDVCHTCRRCIMLCDSFPRLFDLIDNAESGELDTVDSAGFKPVADACTLCDMCYIVSCPYVPPHEYAIDFPHLMARYRALEHKNGQFGFFERELGETDRNGKLIGPVAPLANWASSRKNRLTRPIMESVAGIHRDASLPKFHGNTFSKRAKAKPPAVDKQAPAAGRKAVLYATCFVEYNNPGIGVAAQAILAKNGVETEVVYPTCCGMPQLERGDIDSVCARAKTVAGELGPWIDKGYDVVALVPSCALMLKMEWPLHLPEDPAVKKLAEATSDIAEYIVGIARAEGLAEGLEPIEGRRRPASRLPRAGPEHRRQIGRHAAHDPQVQRHGDAALLGPWRLVGRDEGQFRGRHEGRRKRDETGRPERANVSVLGVPAGRRSYRPGHGGLRRWREAGRHAVPPPDRAVGDELRHRFLKRSGGRSEMPRESHRITPADLMPMDDYAAQREARQHALDATTALRRVEVGPFATFHFESYDTMWRQVHEMLFIERGGAAQVEGELATYNPLVPQGREFVATLMIGIGDPARRDRELARLGGIEDTVRLRFGEQSVRAVAETEVERTKASGPGPHRCTSCTFR